MAEGGTRKCDRDKPSNSSCDARQRICISADCLSTLSSIQFACSVGHATITLRGAFLCITLGWILKGFYLSRRSISNQKLQPGRRNTHVFRTWWTPNTSYLSTTPVENPTKSTKIARDERLQDSQFQITLTCLGQFFLSDFRHISYENNRFSEFPTSS